jgi:formyltetrahydrofolate hydrolase
VYAVSSFLIQHSANILASQQHRGKPGRAVTWHAEHRVPLNGDQTVVFH